MMRVRSTRRALAVATALSLVLVTTLALAGGAVGPGGGIATASAAGPVADGQSADWPMPGHDSARTGHNPDSAGPRTNVSLAWECSSCDGATQPVVANGTVYVGGNYGGNVTALDASDGSVRWTDGFPGNPRDVAVVDGTGYVVNDTSVMAFDADTGSIVWSHTSAGASGRYVSDVTVANGTVFYGVKFQGSTSEHLYALDADTGAEHWTFAAENITQGIAVANGTVYVTGENATDENNEFTTWLYALSADTGAAQWHYEWAEPESSVDYYAREAPVVADGTVYVPAYKRVKRNGGITVDHYGHVYAFDADGPGTPLWGANFTGDMASGTPRIAVTNDTIYANSMDYRLHALDADTGVRRWNTSQFAAGDSGADRSYPAVAGGMVYVVDTDGNLRGFDDGAGEELWSRYLGYVNHYSPSVANGSVYTVAGDGHVQAWGGDYVGSPNATASASVVDFDPTLVDETANRTVTVRNDGTTEMAVTDVTVSGANASAFDASWGGSTTLAPGESTTITVAFGPASAGAKSAALTVGTNDSDVSVSLAGNATTERAHFSVTLDGTNAPVVEGTTMAVDATVENTGGVERTWNATLRTASTDRDDAAVTLAPGASANVTLSWATSPGDAGEYTATVATRNDSDSTSVSVESDAGVTIVDACTSLGSSGTYVLNDSISDENAAPCIEITASDVIFDGQGHALDGYWRNDGVQVAAGLQNVTVRDVELTGWGTALAYQSVDGGTVRSVTATENENGITVDGASNVTVRNSVVRNNSNLGISVTGGSNTTVRDSTIDDGATALHVQDATSALVRNNSVSGSADGIEVDGSNATVRDNAISVGGYGIYATTGATITATANVIQSSQTGVYLLVADGNTLADNVVWNSQRGIALAASSNNTISNTTMRNTSGWAVHASATFDGPSANNTVTGLDLEHASSTLSATLRDAALQSVAPGNAPAVPSGTDGVGLTLDTEQTDSAGYLNLTAAYDDAAISSVDESTVSLWRHDGSAWTDVGGALDTGANTLSNNVTGTFGTLAMLGNTSTQTASYDVRVDSTNSPVTEGDQLTVTATIENVGSQADTQTITLATNGTQRDAQSVSLNAGESTTVTLTWDTAAGDAGGYTATVASANDTDTTAVSVGSLAAADFAVNLSSTTSPVTENETLSVSGTVENVGGQSGTQTVTLSTNGTVRDSQAVSLSAGGSTAVTFDWPTADGDEGNYTATIASANDTATTPVAVEAPATGDSNLSVTLDATNAPVTEGALLNVTGTVEHSGSQQANGTLTLLTNGTIRDSSAVSLAGGQNETVTLAWQTEAGDAGNYTVVLGIGETAASTEVQIQANESGDGGSGDGGDSGDGDDGGSSGGGGFYLPPDDGDDESTGSASGTPDAVISLDDATVTAGTEISLFASNSTVEDGEIVAYEWSIDGQTIEGEDVTTTIEEPGTYEVELTVTTDAGQTNTTTRSVTVESAGSGDGGSDDGSSGDDGSGEDGDEAGDGSADAGGDDGTATTSDDAGEGDSGDDGSPGFGALLALVAIGIALLAMRRDRS